MIGTTCRHPACSRHGRSWIFAGTGCRKFPPLWIIRVRILVSLCCGKGGKGGVDRVLLVAVLSCATVAPACSGPGADGVCLLLEGRDRRVALRIGTQ